jgi:hypothetical protein
MLEALRSVVQSHRRYTAHGRGHLQSLAGTLLLVALIFIDLGDDHKTSYCLGPSKAEGDERDHDLGRALDSAVDPGCCLLAHCFFLRRTPDLH